MGEITDALLKARLERERRLEEERVRAPQAEAEGARLPLPRPGAAEASRTSVFGWPATEEAGEAIAIDRTRRGSWHARAVLVDRSGPSAERFRHLAVRIRQELQRLDQRVLFVTSAQRQEGKTLTSCNLALALASIAGGERIALVDLDLRRRSLAKALGVQASAGVDGVLQGSCALSDVRIPTDLPALDLFPAVGRLDDPHELLAGPRLSEMLEALAARYRFVICDTPPVLLVPDVPLVISRTGACLFVVRAGATRRAALLDALNLIPTATVIGIFLNDLRSLATARYGYGYGDDAEPRDDAGRSRRRWRRR
jgi:receptor protein-tyrosine kinase/non-specific protein-tyrosine kinase